MRTLLRLGRQTFHDSTLDRGKGNDFQVISLDGLKGAIATTSQGFTQIKVENVCKANIRERNRNLATSSFLFSLTTSLQPISQIFIIQSDYIFSPLYVNYVNSLLVKTVSK